jgi:hypothetical protein
MGPGSSAGRASTVRAPADRGRVALAAILALIVAWVLLGLMRAEAAARDWFTQAHGEGARVVDVEVDGVFPAVPPFWQVTLSGGVVEAGRTAPVYRSYMVVWIEPITGFGFAGAAG